MSAACVRGWDEEDGWAYLLDWSGGMDRIGSALGVWRSRWVLVSYMCVLVLPWTAGAWDAGVWCLVAG